MNKNNVIIKILRIGFAIISNFINFSNLNIFDKKYSMIND